MPGIWLEISRFIGNSEKGKVQFKHQYKTGDKDETLTWELADENICKLLLDFLEKRIKIYGKLDGKKVTAICMDSQADT